MESVEIILPTGFPNGNQWSQHAGLRPLCGADELFLRESAPHLFQVEKNSLLLSRCVTHLGNNSKLDYENIRDLTIGDRDALLFHLRRISYGEKIQSILTCPHEDCKKKMDLEFLVDHVLVPISNERKNIFHETISNNGVTYRLKFRLPTGRDQEYLAKSVSNNNFDLAAELLLKRCIIEMSIKDGLKSDLENLPMAVKETLTKKMSQHDPQAEILLNLTCPSCHQPFTAPFDIGSFIFNELMEKSQQLYREIHILASHYHWSETEILNLSHNRRHTYLKLLSESM